MDVTNSQRSNATLADIGKHDGQVYAKVDLNAMKNAVNKLPHQPPTDILPPHE